MSAAVWAAFVAACSSGAVCRHLIDGWVQHHLARPFPWGIWVVNVGGSLALGILVGMNRLTQLGEVPLIVAGTGFCGAYTTFSTVAVHTVQLAEDGLMRHGLLNAVGSLVAGLAAAAAGLWLGSL